MPKNEHQIIEFHGGTNEKSDPRDIADNQNVSSSLSIYNNGRIAMEGSFKNVYQELGGVDTYSHAVTANAITSGFGLFTFSHDYTQAGSLEKTNYLAQT